METGFHPQSRVRETRMHLHVTHVIRSRLAFLPARTASYAGLAWISLQAEGWGSIDRASGPEGLKLYV